MTISQRTKESIADALAAAIIEHAKGCGVPFSRRKATHIKLSVEQISLDDGRLCMDVDWTDKPEGKGWIPLEE